MMQINIRNQKKDSKINFRIIIFRSRRPNEGLTLITGRLVKSKLITRRLIKKG